MYYYWVPSQPYFEPFLLVSSDTSEDLTLSVFDVDGNKVNNITVNCSESGNQVTPLEPFLASCKSESGFRHAVVAIDDLPSNVTVQCRLHSPLGSHVNNPLLVLNDGQNGFFPFTIEEGVTNLLALINPTDQTQSVRYRWYSADKSKEDICDIAPRATRLLHIEAVIAESAMFSDKKMIHGYMRVAAKASGSVAVQLLTKEIGSKDLPVFSAI